MPGLTDGAGRRERDEERVVAVALSSLSSHVIAPAEMVARDPKLKKYANGMPGGPNNPLGARALYLYEGGHDTIYRIHGTAEPWSIGLDVSSGCIRMNNDDVTDLHSRIEIGAKVIVLMQGAALYKGV